MNSSSVGRIKMEKSKKMTMVAWFCFISKTKSQFSFICYQCKNWQIATCRTFNMINFSFNFYSILWLQHWRKKRFRFFFYVVITVHIISKELPFAFECRETKKIPNGIHIWFELCFKWIENNEQWNSNQIQLKLWHTLIWGQCKRGAWH